MSSGSFHDKVGLVSWAMGTAIAASQFTPAGTALLSAGFLSGVLWLSPDIDAMHHRPCKRWGILKWIWIPYHETHGHRSEDWWKLFSRWGYRGHWPVFGSAERLLYLSLWFGIASAIAAIILLNLAPESAIDWITSVDIQGIWASLTVFWMGLEASCCLHILCDYLPLVRHDFENI